MSDENIKQLAKTDEALPWESVAEAPATAEGDDIPEFLDRKLNTEALKKLEEPKAAVAVDGAPYAS